MNTDSCVSPFPLPEQNLREIGITQWGVIPPAAIVFSEEIRKLCEGNACRLYGKTWACPPAVGTVAQCRTRCLQYQNALVFNGVYPLEDSFDYEGMLAGHAAFQKLCDRLYAHLSAVETQEPIPCESPRFLLLSNEGCSRCRECTYPKSPCRMPQILFPSLEGFGIQVFQLAETAGISYTHGANTVTYFGTVFYG